MSLLTKELMIYKYSIANIYLYFQVVVDTVYISHNLLTNFPSDLYSLTLPRIKKYSVVCNKLYRLSTAQISNILTREYVTETKQNLLQTIQQELLSFGKK